MSRLRTGMMLAAATLLTAGCADLDVENLNAPNRERAVDTPGDVESLISGSFRSWWYANHGFTPGPALSAAADEHTASWANFMMKDISDEPRAAINNDPSYTYSYVLEDPWFYAYSSLSGVRDGLIAIEGGVEIGTPSETRRARAFGKFVQGLALGTLALLYDQAFILDETVELSGIELSPHAEVMERALTALDEAIRLAEGGSFTIPPSWIGNVEITAPFLARLAHSYRARYMASEGRTPEEREAADWTRILGEVEAGVTEDFFLQGDGLPWLGGIWYDMMKTFGGVRPGWARVDVRTLGPADQTGCPGDCRFADWSAAPPSAKTPFLIDTDDARITGGDPREDGTLIEFRGPSPFRPERGVYHFSFYGDRRWREFNDASSVGRMDELTVEEMELLKAEALVRLGRPAEALPILNRTRTAAELPEATESGVSGPRCVPRTETGACGDLWDVLKHEKRVEVWHTGMGIAFFDDRGWGDLLPGTPVHFPVPGSELLTLLREIYTFGGQEGGAAPTRITDVDLSPEIVRARARVLERIRAEYVFVRGVGSRTTTR